MLDKKDNVGWTKERFLRRAHRSHWWARRKKRSFAHPT